MIPVEKVIKCEPSDTIGSVVDKLLENHISAIVIADGNKAAGIITKTDITKCYKKGISLDELAEKIMSTDVKTVSRSLPRDKAAAVFAAHRIHHAVVVDDEGNFVGFISAWDCAREGHLDDQAWPWNRRTMGRRA